MKPTSQDLVRPPPVCFYGDPPGDFYAGRSVLTQGEPFFAGFCLFSPRFAILVLKFYSVFASSASGFAFLAFGPLGAFDWWRFSWSRLFVLVGG